MLPAPVLYTLEHKRIPRFAVTCVKTNLIDLSGFIRMTPELRDCNQRQAGTLSSERKKARADLIEIIEMMKGIQ